MGWLQEKEGRLPPLAWHPCFENMWPGNNWVTTAAVQWVGLDLENDSIYFCLTACCFHSCSFYSPFRSRVLLYRPGRKEDERMEYNLSINILTHIQWIWKENSIVLLFIVRYCYIWGSCSSQGTAGHPLIAGSAAEPINPRLLLISIYILHF